MDIMLERIKDKIECFEAYDLKTLEKKIEEQIEKNKALMLQVIRFTTMLFLIPTSKRCITVRSYISKHKTAKGFPLAVHL